MAKVGAQRAAELTGTSKSTIQRAMNGGKLSFEVDRNGRRVIDVSELDRVFGLAPQGVGAGSIAPVNNDAVEAELKRTADMMEMERIKMRVKVLEDQVESLKDQLNDTRAQRDQWQRQAQQVLITSQFSQKQAEDLKAELVERDQRAKARRQQELDSRMKTLQDKSENQNQSAKTEAKPGSSLWQKLLGESKDAA